MGSAHDDNLYYAQLARERMTPTDAQIEAAKAGVRDEYGSHLCMWRDTGERVCRKEFNESCLCEQIGLAALTAAAEVGEHKCWTRKDAELQKELFREEKNATIERCAQVAEMMHEREFRGNAIAAAIRALRDKEP